MSDLISTFFLYRDIEGGGIKILRCKSLDTMIEIPETIAGKPVVELGAYVFSAHERQREAGRWTGTEGEVDGIPEVQGEGLTGLSLPAGLMKVGAYALYNCWNLERLACHSTTLDWGAGAFTGCTGIKELDVQVREGEKSCLKEVLTELRQTLFVHYHGRQEARLVFPEFYEESVENTPARILVTHMHGCGHQYRYCFLQSEFQFGAYDNLFCHVRVQEAEELVIKLAANRLRFPYGLFREAMEIYTAYIREHRVAAAVYAVCNGDMGMLRWLTEGNTFGKEELSQVIEAASEGRDRQLVSYLMGLFGSQSRPVEKTRRKRFEL